MNSDSGSGGPPAIVTLSSDFGWGSPYVAVMKAVILEICPAARLVDVAHALAPFSPAAAAFPLWVSSRAFPGGSVHLAVVDPGVGTERRPVAVLTEGRWYVGPDNGVFGLVIAASQARGPGPERAFQLEVPESAAPTFHGRDVFAPAAARLARGDDPARLGFEVDATSLMAGPTGPPRVLYVDRFGNLVTSLVPPIRGVEVAGRRITRWVRTFAESGDDQPFCYLGSSGLVEVAVREGRADRILGAGLGDPVSPLDAESG